MEIQDRLNTLSNDQRIFMIYLAKDYRPDEIGRELKLDNEALYQASQSLIKHFELPLDQMQKSLDQIAAIGRDNHFHTAPLPGANADSLAGGAAPDSSEEESDGEPGGDDGNLGQGSERSSTPEVDFDAVVAILCGFNNAELAMFGRVLNAKRGDDIIQVLADEAEVPKSTMVGRVGKLYKKIAIPSYPGRKKLFIRAYKAAQDKLKARVQPKPEKPVKLETPQTPQPPALASASPHPPAAQNGHSSLAALVTPGQSALVPVPATVVDADVVSGLFTGQHPAAGLREQIRKHKEGGFKPSFLVLTTSNDPTVVQGQVVFFKHEEGHTEK